MVNFDFGLGDDIDLLRDTVGAFAADRIAPRAAAIDAGNEFPADLWPELGELGLLGITVEEDLGGAGLGYLAHVVAMEEISDCIGKAIASDLASGAALLLAAAEGAYLNVRINAAYLTNRELAETTMTRATAVRDEIRRHQDAIAVSVDRLLG